MKKSCSLLLLLCFFVVQYLPAQQNIVSINATDDVEKETNLGFLYQPVENKHQKIKIKS